MASSLKVLRLVTFLLFGATALFLPSCGGNNSGGGGTTGNPPAAPAGLTATAGDQQVSLSWSASSGATSYAVRRGTASGGPYTSVASPTTTSYTDTGLTDGTIYYYVVTASNSYGSSGNSNEASATPELAVPAAPTNLTATPGNQQVSLSWSASTNAASYNVLRSTTNGSGYTKISSPTATSYTDTGLTNGTTYYYVVTATNSSGTSGNSNQASATPTGSSSTIAVTVNVLANRHTISPFIYGGAFPQDAAHITDSGLSLVRWGGNGASTYNWELGTDNADNDYYFEDYSFGALNNSADSNSTQFISDVKSAGSHPLMTMVMMNWVAQSPETSVTQGGTNNFHWSYSVATYGQQCSVDQYNIDAGDGLKPDCSTHVTTNPVTTAYYPLLDSSAQTCSAAHCVYRNAWAQAMAAAFGSGTCAIPYSTITSCHFYDMDNEIDIWGGTHFDIHPSPSGYDELANVYLTEAANLKSWDPQAVRLGPVSCCWWFYWNGENNSDKAAHGGLDFLPWWLNEIYWGDQISGSRSLDIFDVHAYPDGPDTSSYTKAQKQAAAVSIYRDYWDPTLVSPSTTIDQIYTTNIQPSKTIAFRIPRMRAIVNMIYPGTPLAFTEWSAAFAGESDFSTALGDADAYGILGRERMSLATRWEAPVSANPNYQALKLYTNYDGSHHAFGSTSVLDTNSGNANTFSSYAALNSTGTAMTLMVLNKDPQNSAQVQFTLTGFTPTTYVSYTLASTAPTTITASSSQSWSATQTFSAYSATLLVISGSLAKTPASDWDLNPDTIMVPAGGTVTLNPKLTAGSSTVNLSSAAFDSFEGASACTGGGLTLSTPSITSGANGEITVTAPGTPGFCHYTVTGSDGTATQTQGGWIVVGNPPATLTATAGDNQTGTAGSTLPTALSVTLAPGQSGGAAAGAPVFFTTSAGTLSYTPNGGTTVTGSKIIAVTNSSGVASVTLTLPSSSGTVQVQAQAPIALGGSPASFTETSQ
ncbi:MAG TPA: glycoside hydrolase family 44 protein [Verrucomicrobiae bacterium]|nr:glycoside hydrolase family 44 protein [Verrucomicrobiae bacterium]